MNSNVALLVEMGNRYLNTDICILILVVYTI